MATTTQTAPRAILARVGRVYFGNRQASDFRFGCNGLTGSAMLPKRQPPAQSPPSDRAFLGLWHVQVLKDKDSVERSPLDQVFGRLLGKGAGAMTAFATEPFEKTANRAGIFLLCLTGRMFGLNAGTGLGGTDILHFDGLATDKEAPPVRVNGNECIGFIEINPQRKSSFGQRAHL